MNDVVAEVSLVWSGELLPTRPNLKWSNKCDNLRAVNVHSATDNSKLCIPCTFTAYFKKEAECRDTRQLAQRLSQPPIVPLLLGKPRPRDSASLSTEPIFTTYRQHVPHERRIMQTKLGGKVIEHVSTRLITRHVCFKEWEAKDATHEAVVDCLFTASVFSTFALHGRLNRWPLSGSRV